MRVRVVNRGERVDWDNQRIVGRVQESKATGRRLCTVVKWQEWVRPEGDGVRLDGVRPLRLAIPSFGCGERWAATGGFGQLTEAVLRWALT